MNILVIDNFNSTKQPTIFEQPSTYHLKINNGFKHLKIQQNLNIDFIMKIIKKYIEIQKLKERYLLIF